MPARGRRAGIPGAGRAAFGPGRGDRIRIEEAFWSGAGLVATPNRFPFFWPQLLLWPEKGTMREPDADFLAACFALARREEGTLLFNTIGASASIPLAHAHLLAAMSPVLEHVELEEVASTRDIVCRATQPGSRVPFLVVEIEAEDDTIRAAWTRRLLDLRRTPAINVLARGRRSWILPRRMEVPAPHFPYAVGAGELGGRFVYPDQDAFRAATAADLAAALRLATVIATEAELASLRRVVLA